MHGDYQVAYCPITQIISLAFRDEAFLNTALTPELIWRLRVPKRSQSLPVRWKQEKLNLPLLRRVEQTPYGYEVHTALPMMYDSSRQALKYLGRDAGFEDELGHYNYRRWTANEANRTSPLNEILLRHLDGRAIQYLFNVSNSLSTGNFTSQERKRVLGQSGDGVFERHYQSEFVQRDLQHVVLLRPSQEGLLRQAGSMLRNRDPLAPSDLTDEQRKVIRRDPEILELRRERRELKEEMRSLAGTVQNARKPFPNIYHRHDEVKKSLAKLRKTLVDGTKQTIRKDYFHNTPVLEIDRQIEQLLGKGDGAVLDDMEDDEEISLPIPEYIFPERARLVEAFYGPEAESFEEDQLLARRIQVTKDMVAFSRLCEPNRRGKRVNWEVDEESGKEEEEDHSLTQEESLRCPLDECIICSGMSRSSPSNPPPHKFPPNRMDSVRRHLIDVHLAHVDGGLCCTWKVCRGHPPFMDITGFLAHAATIHKYDVNIKLAHLSENYGREVEKNGKAWKKR
jgi:hypothetical protein